MNEIDAVSVPGYRIVSRIMAGGMATVYVAEQLKLGSRRVAIKIFRQQNSDHTKARHKRFAQEALIARNLQHPHIVQIFDYGSTDDFQFLTMEYLAHGDLKQRIREGLQPSQVLQILQQIASALSLLHQSDIVHRDIKPANILFREPDHAVLADFGIARSIEQNTQLTNTGFVLGTPSYMSPEQINGGRITAKTDMYALGVLFYEMLTGHLPYRGDSVQSVATQHLMAPVPPLPLQVRRLQSLLNRLMAKKPEERIANGDELLQLLARIDVSRGFAVKPPSFLQIHVRKIVAIAALMFCSVAITWAGISQLPAWLNDVVPLATDIRHQESLPPAMQQPVAVPRVPAPQDLISPEADAHTAILSESVDLKQEVLQPMSVDKGVVDPVDASGQPSRIAGKPAVKPENKNDKNSRKKGNLEKSSTVTKTKFANPAEIVIDEEISSVPTLQAVAERHAAYDIEAAVTPSARQDDMRSGGEMLPVSDMQAVTDMHESTAPHEPALEKKKKLPPVISYF